MAAYSPTMRSPPCSPDAHSLWSQSQLSSAHVPTICPQLAPTESVPDLSQEALVRPLQGIWSKTERQTAEQGGLQAMHSPLLCNFGGTGPECLRVFHTGTFVDRVFHRGRAQGTGCSRSITGSVECFGAAAALPATAGATFLRSPGLFVSGTHWVLASRSITVVVGPRRRRHLCSPCVSLLAPSNTWVTKRSMAPRMQAVAVSINHIIYVVGGLSPSDVPTRTLQATMSPPTPGRPGRPCRAPARVSTRPQLSAESSIQRVARTAHSSSSRRCTFKADMPIAGACGGQGVINNQLYVYLGCTTGPSTDHAFLRYNPATNTWVTRAKPHPE